MDKNFIWWKVLIRTFRKLNKLSMWVKLKEIYTNTHYHWTAGGKKENFESSKRSDSLHKSISNKINSWLPHQKQWRAEDNGIIFLNGWKKKISTKNPQSPGPPQKNTMFQNETQQKYQKTKP